MATTGRKPIPKTQKEISIGKHTAIDKEQGNPNFSGRSNRGTQKSAQGETTKPLTIGIQDIDEAVFYYFQNIIRPSVVQNGNKIEVPVLYGAPEKWKAIQKDGYYRDKNGAIMLPVIVIKRDTIEKNRTIANKLDANNPNNFAVVSTTWNKDNYYSKFNVLNNRIPTKTYFTTVVPDYVTLDYSCLIQTYYIDQLNKIVEAINYASDAYWGDPQRFQFRAMIDSFATPTELVQDNNRVVRANFNIRLNGYLIPDVIQKNGVNFPQFSERSKILFSMETVSDPGIFIGNQNSDGRIETPTPQELEAQKRVNKSTLVP